MRREKRPTIDERTKKVVLSRLFGENYVQKPSTENTYLGYIDGAIVEVFFYNFLCSVFQRTSEYKEVKFANIVMNKFFATRGLKSSTMERINFDNTTCAHVMYDKEGVSFYFWYRLNKKEV